MVLKVLASCLVASIATSGLILHPQHNISDGSHFYEFVSSALSCLLLLDPPQLSGTKSDISISKTFLIGFGGVAGHPSTNCDVETNGWEDCFI